VLEPSGPDTVSGAFFRKAPKRTPRPPGKRGNNEARPPVNVRRPCHTSPCDEGRRHRLEVGAATSLRERRRGTRAPAKGNGTVLPAKERQRTSSTAPRFRGAGGHHGYRDHSSNRYGPAEYAHGWALMDAPGVCQGRPPLCLVKMPCHRPDGEKCVSAPQLFTAGSHADTEPERPVMGHHIKSPQSPAILEHSTAQPEVPVVSRLDSGLTLAGVLRRRTPGRLPGARSQDGFVGEKRHDEQPNGRTARTHRPSAPRPRSQRGACSYAAGVRFGARFDAARG
jgi:hypothetical protein